eukprot:Tamp_20223.p1 GENE.Tamp_20223~~Tamp_20223.p1  ORF type:complete len:261 (+),score=83.15 Tamp_20223:87-869(+)
MASRRGASRWAGRWAALLVLLVVLVTPAAPAASKEEDLLAQVLGQDDEGLGREAGLDDVIDLDNIDDLDDERTYGQREMPSLEDVIEEERGYFLRTDSDGDERLSKKEFIKHFLDSMGDFSQVNITDESDKDAAFSFSEFDANADGFVDWSEWSHMMFHEGEQDPEYRDGEEVVPSEFPSADQVAHLQRLFQQGDTDKSGSLSKDEVSALLKGDNGMAGEMSLSDDEIDMVTWQLFDDQDGNKDMLLSVEEWTSGGGYLS